MCIRDRYGTDQVFTVGFGTYEGTVIAANAWEAPTQTMNVPQAYRNSWENLFHEANASDQMIILDHHTEAFVETRGHRAIGVVYHPRNERGNYVPTVLARRYDAFIFLDQTHALQPLELTAREPILATE